MAKIALSTDMAAVSCQLLLAYSPRAHSESIRVHIDAIRANNQVWWGRFHRSPDRLDESAARAKWPHVAALADARAAEKEALLLYVTDFVALHVCKVRRVVFGDRAETRAEAPAHYGDRSIPIWFLVEDVRALSFDHRQTADAFAALGDVTGAFRSNDLPYSGEYDPHAAIRYAYPVVVSNGGTVSELFPGKKRWADDDDTILPRPVKRAAEALAKRIACWKRLDPLTCDELAHARHLYDGVVAGDLHAGVSFGRFGVAIEQEVGRRLCGSFGALGAKLTADRWPLGAVFAEHAKKGDFTIGAALGALRMLTKQKSALQSVKLEKLIALAEHRAWLATVGELRNFSQHPSEKARDKMQRLLHEFFKGKGAELVPVLDARDQVEKWRA